MKLYKRDNTRLWWMDFTDEHGKRQRRSTRCTDKAAAQMRAAAVIRNVELRRAGVQVADPLAALRPIEGVIDEYCAALDQRGDHARITRARLRRAARDARWQSCRDIAPEAIRLHIEGLTWHGRPVRGRTRNQVRESIRCFCQWAMRQRPPLMAINPVDAVGRYADNDDRRRSHLTADEVEALLAAPPPANALSRARWPARRLAYLLAWDAGLRRGDMKHLRAGRVRLGGVNQFIELEGEHTKGRRFEQVPLTRRLAAELSAWIDGRDPAEPVLATLPSVDALRRDLERAGIEWRNPMGVDVDLHTLRHSFSCRVALAGAPMAVHQALMRHADRSTTDKVYTNLGLGPTAQWLRALETVTPTVPNNTPDCARSVPTRPRNQPRPGTDIAV